MRYAKRGRGSRHWVYLGIVAALGLALSGCGGSDGGSASAAAASATSTQGTDPAQGASVGSAAASGSGTTASTGKTGGTSTASGGGTSASTGESGGTGAATGGGSSAGGTSGGKTGSGSTAEPPPPTAKADTVTINWTPPTENTNGTPLTNLAGYSIHYGTSSGNLTRRISISNPGIATLVVSNLSPGRYYFAVAAVNSAGTESPLSAQVSTNVSN